MNSIIYKVIFKAQEEFENKNFTLSFKNLDFEKELSIPANFLTELKKISEKNNQVLNFQNIEEVLIIGNPVSKYSYNYYIVVLFTIKSDGKRVGYLIGNVKNLGDIVIGIWPFNINPQDTNKEKVFETCNDIVQNPNNYNNICLISQ